MDADVTVTVDVAEETERSQPHGEGENTTFQPDIESHPQPLHTTASQLGMVEGLGTRLTSTADAVEGRPSDNGSLDVDSENATRFGTIPGDDEPLQDQLSDVSDTGWDTDLEIEEEKEEYDVTGTKIYQESCNTLGIIPASYFVRTLQVQEPQINMSHHGVGPKGAKAIAIALTSNTVVTHLDLSDNGLGTEGGMTVTDMLKENCYITHLDLSDNGMGSAAAYAIALMVGSNSTLTHLSLRGNGFSDKAAEPMSEVIKSSYKVKFLDLSHNEFGEVAGGILGPALADSEVLRTLDLSWNHIRRKGAVAIAAGLKNNQTLKVLNLAYNGLANEGAVAIADALKVNSTLEELDISNNRIPPNGAAIIAKVLPANESLQILKIGKNPIQPPGVFALLNAVKGSSNNALQCLDFDGITITLDIAKLIKEMEESHAHLRVSHGGTGGYKEPKPLLEPVQKLAKYCKENKVQLIDLFRSFDKEQSQTLPEEEFRNALKHISAPLMEFERLKLIKRFKKEGEGENISIDYNALVEATTSGDGS